MATLILDKVGLRTSSSKSHPHWLLQGVSVECKQGEHIGLLGRNGSGKSALARLLAQLERPTSGTFRKVPASTRVMLLLQRPEEYFAYPTVKEQIASYAPSRLSRSAFETHLHQVGLPPDVALIPPLRLSMGEQRLVAIACVLATQSPFLILDEPMAGLDSGGRKRVREALQQVSTTGDVGFIITSHHPDDLLGLVERLWVLEEGQLIHDGPFTDVPLDVLEKCLSSNDTSIYRFLRELQSRGIRVPPDAYHHPDPASIAGHLLSVVMTP